MDGNTINRAADAFKNAGTLQRGDVLHLPAGTSFDITTDSGDRIMYTFEREIFIGIHDITYDRYEIFECGQQGEFVDVVWGCQYIPKKLFPNDLWIVPDWASFKLRQG